MKISLATKITLLRILLTPWIAYLIIQQQFLIALGLFITALMTDFFDGYVARTYEQESMFGALLDPIADKVLIVGSFVAFLKQQSLDQFIIKVIWFLIAKEIIIIFGAALLYLCCSIFIRPSILSRLASVAEMGLIILLLLTKVTSIVWPMHTIALGICLLSVMLLVRYGLYICMLVRK